MWLYVTMYSTSVISRYSTDSLRCLSAPRMPQTNISRAWLAFRLSWHTRIINTMGWMTCWPSLAVLGTITRRSPLLHLTFRISGLFLTHTILTCLGNGHPNDLPRKITMFLLQPKQKLFLFFWYLTVNMVYLLYLLPYAWLRILVKIFKKIIQHLKTTSQLPLTFSA